MSSEVRCFNKWCNKRHVICELNTTLTIEHYQAGIGFNLAVPSTPRTVLKEVQHELLDFNNGMSVMEISHRGKEYAKINNDAQTDIRTLLNVPDNYKILFLQGGGCAIFAAVALNLMKKTGLADYVVTGTWSTKAAREAEKYGKVNLVCPKQEKAGIIPPQSTWTLNPDASYLYYCDNETVNGVEFHYIPQTVNNVPLVADMSSNIMTKQIDISKFGMIFAGAQKNMGPAGVTLVIVREDLLGSPMTICPSVLDFTLVDKENSIHNTPPTFVIYVVGKVLQWITQNGGVENMEKLCHAKSNLLYDTIKASNGFYHCPVEEHVRSRINVPFKIGGPNGNETLETLFLAEAAKFNMHQLKGHRQVGGVRASLYNAVLLEDVNTLVTFMKSFQKEHSDASVNDI